MEALTNPAEVKASSPIRTSLYEREGSMWGSLKRPSLRRPSVIPSLSSDLFPLSFKAISKRLGIPVPLCLRPENINKPISAIFALGSPLATGGTQERRPSMIDKSRSDDSDLCHEMLTTFGFTQDQMHRAAERFHLGRSKSGKTIYWMIDDLGICHDGRIGNSWVTTMLKARYPDCASYITADHCLFGLHQISEEGPIGIVESERSAVLLSELCPELLWLAYSYGANCTVDKFEPLQNRKVTIFPRASPDNAEYYAFLELADQIKRTYKSIDISVSSFLDTHTTPSQKSHNIDLVDFLYDKQL